MKEGRGCGFAEGGEVREEGRARAGNPGWGSLAGACRVGPYSWPWRRHWPRKREAGWGLANEEPPEAWPRGGWRRGY